MRLPHGYLRSHEETDDVSHVRPPSVVCHSCPSAATAQPAAGLTKSRVFLPLPLSAIDDLTAVQLVPALVVTYSMWWWAIPRGGVRVGTQLAERPVPGSYDLGHLQAFHRHIFGDVYDWAGEIRTVAIANGDMFALALLRRSRIAGLVGLRLKRLDRLHQIVVTVVKSAAHARWRLTVDALSVNANDSGPHRALFSLVFGLCYQSRSRGV
jgi:hypothetical protein